jgi:hypothetical protein
MTLKRGWRWALPTIAAMITCGAFAADPERSRQGAGAGLFLSHDNEGFSTKRLALGYFPVFEHGDALTGVRYTAHRFEQDDWSRNEQQLTVMHRSVDPATSNGWQLEAGLSRQGGHDLLSLDGSYRTALAAQTGLELFINRDWVETRAALDRGVSFTFAGAALEQGLGPHVTLIGLAGYQDFSDGNHRMHGRLKLVLQPDLDLGLTLQARYRAYTSSREDVGGAYFNPSRYEEAMLAVGWRHRIRGWMGSLIAGVGQQWVADAPRMPTRLLELALQTPPNHAYTFRIRGGLNRSASFGGPDYSYRYVQVELVFGF